MASFTKRGKTWTYIVSRYTNGKYKPIRKGGFKTKKEAEIAAREVENKLDKGMEVKLKPKPFNEYFEEWYKLYKVKIEDNTLRHYKYTLKAIEDFLGDIAIQKITKNKYQKFLNDFGEGKARETVSKVNSHIRESVLDAIDEGLIHIDFTRKATIYYTVEAKKP